MNAAARKYDPFVRGTKDGAPKNTGAMVLLRFASPMLQYYLLTSPVLPRLLTARGLATLPALTFGELSTTSMLGLTPGRRVLLAMSIGSALKQGFWAVFLNLERLHGASAISIGLVNVALDSLASLLYLWRVTCPAGPLEQVTPVIQIALGLFMTGIITETTAEIQRRNFKQDARNEGKLFTRGLWGWSRHPNYAGYLLWRFGHAMACMGYAGIPVALAGHVTDFVSRAVPLLEDYCQKRYKAQWDTYTRHTPYKLFPFIY